MKMHDPAHPGEVLADIIATGTALTAAQAARHLGISASKLRKTFAGQRRIDADMAARLSLFTHGNVEHAGHWLRMQADHDEWLIRQSKRLPRVKPAPPLAA